MKKMQRRVVAGAIALGTLAGLAGTAHAADKTEQVNDRFEFVVTNVDNPCTPEPDGITLNGSGHAVVQMWTGDDGTTRRQTVVHIHLSGSAADGTRYVGMTGFRARTDIGDGLAEITADSMSRLQAQGSGADFVLRLKTHVTFNLNGPGSSYEVIKDQAECR